MPRKVYAPSEPVCICWVLPFSSVSVIATPGIIAPEASFTVPVTVPPFADGRMGLAACAGAGLAVCAREETAVRRASVKIDILRSINVEKNTLRGATRPTQCIGDCFPATVTAPGPDYVSGVTHPSPCADNKRVAL